MTKYVPFGKQTPTDFICEIQFDSCPNKKLYCKLLQINTYGQWWGIFASNLPDRFVCLKNKDTIFDFVTKYGYMDDSECVNYKSGSFGICNRKEWRGSHADVIQSITDIYVPGIPQRTRYSGLCWYSAMCFAAFFTYDLKNIFIQNSKDNLLNKYIETCLYNSNDAEKLRRHLYYKYSLGDDPSQNPENDGQNGLSQLLILLAKLNIPFICLVAPNLSPIQFDVIDQKKKKIVLNNSTPLLLFVRCFRTRWKPELKIKFRGHVYQLVSVLIGSEQCGHQIAAATCNSRISRWALADSDACRAGIGPVFWKVKSHKNESYNQFVSRWWNAWSKMIPVTMFNSDSFCDFSPHNRSSCTLEAKMKKTSCTDFNAGLVNCDFIYIKM